MNELQTFNSPEFGNVRTIIEGDVILFCAKDVAIALGYKDVINAIKLHCRWVVKRHLPHPQSQNKTIEMTFIPEGDLYRLVANSKLPSAVRFQSWVFDEVLPTIRKTGTYSLTEAPPIIAEDIRLKVGEMIATCPKYNMLALIDVLSPYLCQSTIDHYCKLKAPQTVTRPVSDDFAQVLQMELRKNDMTQRDLVKKTGIPQVSVNNYYNGKTKPNRTRIQKIADALGLPVDYFYQ